MIIVGRAPRLPDKRPRLNLITREKH